MMCAKFRENQRNCSTSSGLRPHRHTDKTSVIQTRPLGKQQQS